MSKEKQLDALAEKLSDKKTRLNNLYKIIDKYSNLIDFNLNWMQDDLFNCDHPKIVNLKARQLGSTTYFALSLLDDALFNSHQNIHITSLSQESGEKIFNRIIKNAYNSLPGLIKAMIPVTRERTKGFVFSNGSEITVDTTARSGTITHLLCTEFGKVCARYPQKAEEIITGSLNAVPKGARVAIESTAEGSCGYFYELCQKAMNLEEPLAASQYKFFFFPWWREPTYIETDTNVQIPKPMREYFKELKEVHGIELTDDQKRFYAVKFFENEDKVKQEYPSIASEAFLASAKGFWYQQEIYNLKSKGQVTSLSIDYKLPVHTAWDIGWGDATALWFFQVLPTGQINVVDFYENSHSIVSHYAQVLQEKAHKKAWVYGSHFVPHDADNHDKSGETYVTLGQKVGLEFTVLPKKNKFLGINKVRQSLPNCWFDAINCEVGLIHLESYKKAWNERMQSYTSEDVKDKHRDAADAFRYLIDGADQIKYGEATEAEIDYIRKMEIRDRLTRVYR